MYNNFERYISNKINNSIFHFIKPYIKILYSLPFRLLSNFFVRKNKYKLTEIGQKNYESFFGYFDTSPENNLGYILCHQTKYPTSLKPIKSKNIEICVFHNSRVDNPILKLKSSSFNWQQGTRAQWISNNKFIFNDFDKKKKRYIAKIYNLDGDELYKLEKPIQTLIDENNYLSINFQRIAKLRPDYGYFNLFNEYIDLNNLINDGIWLVNIKNKITKLIYSLQDIVNVDFLNKDHYQHKVNHLCLSPNKKDFIFIHRIFNNNIRFGRLILGSVEGRKLKVIPSSGIVSHYCWLTSDKILCFMNTKKYGLGYHIISIQKNEIKMIEYDHELLSKDGHPYPINRNKFITDTYPNRFGIQNLYTYDTHSKKLNTVLSLYHSVRYKLESRCDLHPRINMKKDICYIDTVNSGKRRLCSFAIDLR